MESEFECLSDRLRGGHGGHLAEKFLNKILFLIPIPSYRGYRVEI